MAWAAHFVFIVFLFFVTGCYMSPTGRQCVFCALALFVVATGCSQLDLGVSSREAPWGDARAAALETDYQRRVRRLAEVLAVWEQQKPEAVQGYRVGPGDMLSVNIFALEQLAAATELKCTVSGEGTIALPYVGELRVQGLTVRQIEQAIRQVYAGQYLKDPQINVDVAEYRSAYVTVAGAVSQPGVYPLVRGQSTVLESLVAAGGLSHEAGDELVLLRPRDMGPEREISADAAPEIARIELKELLDHGNLLLNLPVEAGDVITVPVRTEQFIYVLGYVRRAGAYRIESGRLVDAMRALALGGGLLDTGRARNSYLVRQGPTGEETFAVDLSKVASGELPPLYLQGGDVLIVGTSAWGKMTEFLRPSMGASVNASASVAP